MTPYNPLLLNTFKSHINVEYVHSVKSIKYLIGYHFKGEDLVSVEGLNQFDETTLYATRRYISSCQAYWRFAEFKVINVEPSVLQLNIHLPDKQYVMYEPTKGGALLAMKRSEITMLLGFFYACSCPTNGHIARKLKYEDMPSKYVWNNDKRCWTLRKGQTDQIGRLVVIHPNCGESFYLRLLLKHVRGPRSFSELRKVDGVVHDSFRDACIALDLCDSDKQWEACLNEAVQISHPRFIRDLFCHILLVCMPTKPEDLYTKFKDPMSEDFQRDRSKDVSQTDEVRRQHVTNDLLVYLCKKLEEGNKTNSDFNIPMPDESLTRDTMNTSMEVDPDAESFYDTNVRLLNDEQKLIFDTIVTALDKNEGGLFDLDAPGGCGKTFLANVVLAYIRKSGDIAIATALTSIAATLLKLGMTFHKKFGIPIPCHEDSCSKHAMNSNDSKIIKESRIILIDEKSMMHYHLLDLLNKYLQALMGNDKYMGGKIVILMGDFRQILPVIPGGNRGSIVAAAVVNSEVWLHSKRIQLTTNMRIGRLLGSNPSPERRKQLEDFSRFLLDLGDGKIKPVIPNSNIIEVPQSMVKRSTSSLVESVYPDFATNFNNEDYLESRCIMTSRNDTARQRNYEMLKKIPNEEVEVVYLSRDSCVEPDDQGKYDSDFLNRIEESSLPYHRLVLKVGAVIILIKSLSQRNKDVNGKRYIVEQLTENLIKARRIGGGENSIVLIPRIPTISKDTDGTFVSFKRVQFPVLLAYYLTINRAQGQSLDVAGLELPQSVFTHGQLYVGWSRCGDPNKLFIFANQDEFENVRHLLPLGETKVYTRNIVYKEIFSHTRFNAS